MISCIATMHSFRILRPVVFAFCVNTGFISRPLSCTDTDPTRMTKQKRMEKIEPLVRAKMLPLP